MKRLHLVFKKFVSLSVIQVLFISLLGAIQLFNLSPAKAANTDCSSSYTVNNLSASPAHGKVFYIDSGVTPKLDAAYVGYKITFSGSGTKTGLWAELSGFVGAKVSLANPADSYQKLPDIAAGAANYKTAYYLLKASGATTTSQTHTLKIYDRRPDVTGATALLTCDFTFSQVQETIKASSNKVNTVTGTFGPTTPTLGGTLTVAVTSADTGKVGAGKTPDLSLFWVSPAAVSSWPTQSLRLESVTLVLSCTGASTYGNNDYTLENTLSLSNAQNYCFKSASTWTASYVFRIIGPGPSSFKPSPVAMIASGTQYKHSDIATIATNPTLNLSGVSTSSFRVTVNASSSIVSSTSSSVVIAYTVTMSTTSTQTVSVDEVIDNIASGMTYVAGSAKLNGVTMNEPVTLAAETSPKPLHYIGPFNVVSGSNVVITYQMEIPCGASLVNYQNTVYAKIGTQILGSSSTEISATTVTTQSAGGSCTPTVTNNQTVNITPTASTQAATSVNSSSATLNGFANPYSHVDSNGVPDVYYYFQYSKDPNLVSNVTTTTLTSVAGSSPVAETYSAGSLTSATTYYFRIVVKYTGPTYVYGATLTFTTDAVQAVPTVTTSAATNIGTTTSTLNGSINPNLTPITGVQFVYGRGAGLGNNVSTAATGVKNASTISVTSAAGIQLGMTVSGDNALGANPYVIGISGTTITLSVANSNAVNATLTFSSSNTTTVVQMDDGNGGTTPMTLSGSGATSVLLDITGLTSGVKYYFKLVGSCTTDAAYCPTGSVEGSILNFTTGTPNVVTTDATLVADTSATLNGNVTQAVSSDRWRFIYCAYDVSTCNSAGISSGTSTTITSQGNTTLASVTAALTSLTSGTTYYFQILGLTSASDTPVSYGAVLSFQTLNITTSSPLTGGNVSVAYSASVAGQGGSGSYTWSLGAGGVLPPGLTLSSTGLISGTPTTSGTYSSVVVVMTDPYYGTTTTKTFSITIGAQAFTVNFSANGGTGSMDPQTSNTAANLTANTFSRTGYTFAGWGASSGVSTVVYSDSGSYPFTSSTTLYAQWTANKYSVIYVDTLKESGSVPTEVDQDYGTTYTVLGNTGSLVKTGYTFQGWSKTGLGGPIVSTVTIPDSTTTLTAIWTINTHTVVYNGNNATSGSAPTDGSSPYNYNSTVTVLGNTGSLINTGYNFSGWCTSQPTVGSTCGGTSRAASSTFSITGDVTLFAVWIIKTYTLSYSAGANGSVSFSAGTNPFTVNHGSSGPTVTATASSGYHFVNWSDGSTSNPRQETNVQANLTVTGNFAADNSYIVTYLDNVASEIISVPTDSTNYLNGATVTISATEPSRDGYNFSGWTTDALNTSTLYKNGTANASYVVAGANINFYAKWSAITYTITYNGNIGTTTEPNGSYTSGGSALTLAGGSNTNRSGYTFGGWSTTQNDASTKITSYSSFASITVYAIWTANNYTITYNGNIGTTTEPNGSYTSGGSALTLAGGSNTNRSGYTFGGWSTTQNDASTKITSYSSFASITVYALWTINTYTLTYIAGSDGSVSGTSPQTVNHGANGTAVTPVAAAGHHFVNWSDGSTANPRTENNVQADLTVTANFAADNTYLVTYVDNVSGETISVPTDNSSYLSGASVTISTTEPTRTGYIFNGWTTDSGNTGTLYKTGSANNTYTMGSQDTTFYAKWTANSGGGSSGVGGSSPVITPAPRIISISASDVCAVEGQLTLTGSDLTGASVTVDGLSAAIISSTANTLIINLPTYYVGVRTLRVTNSVGTASTTVKYVLVDRPVYQNFIYPQTFKGQEFSYTFTATDADKYSLAGVMPSGLTLNQITGEVSGTPGVEGTFFFSILASNVCGVTYLHVYMFVDKEIPNAFTCSVLFNVPRSNNITPAKLDALTNCLGKINTLSPNAIDPVVFISGGIPLGLTPEQSLAHPRYKQIVDLISSLGITAQIYVGAFSGSLDTVQLNIYWPEPSV